MTDPLSTWHKFVTDRDITHLDDLLADDVTFRSPADWKPRNGKPITMLILSTAMETFEDFEYHRQWINETDWALEFTAHIGDLALKGVDLITLRNDKITDLEVVIRPPNAVDALRKKMGIRLAAAEGS